MEDVLAHQPARRGAVALTDGRADRLVLVDLHDLALGRMLADVEAVVAGEGRLELADHLHEAVVARGLVDHAVEGPNGPGHLDAEGSCASSWSLAPLRRRRRTEPIATASARSVSLVASAQARSAA